MAKIIIEITHHRGHREQHIVTSEQITIGRGYDNDVIIPDPYLSARHAVLSFDEGIWRIEDISGENGIFIKHGAKKCAKATITSGDEIIIGKTTVRVFYPSHPVEPTKRLIHPNRLFKKTGKHRNGWILLFLTFCSYTLAAYLESSKKISAPELLLSGIAVVIGIVMGAGIWAFIGHLIKNKSRFIHQISIFSMFFLSVLFINEALGILGYLASSSFVVMTASALIIPSLISLLVMANLYIATNISFQKRIIACAAIGFCISGIVFLAYYAGNNEFRSRPEYFYRLKPPLVKVVPSKTVQQFIQKSERIFSHATP